MDPHFFFDAQQQHLVLLHGLMWNAAERRSMVIPEHERRRTAIHEAGHAIVARMLPESDRVHKVTIVPRGRALPQPHAAEHGLRSRLASGPRRLQRLRTVGSNDKIPP